jgi:ubiquinone/menaquinone biosynthesis C-methylase UbiE
MNKSKVNTLKEMYEEGINITKHLQDRDGYNSEEAIEIAYDLQAGSYIDNLNDNEDRIKRYWNEVAKILSSIVGKQERILDCGCGELTTLCGLTERNVFGESEQVYAFDISFSRVNVGKNYISRRSVSSELEVCLCVGSMLSIPFMESSMDVIYTTHALEPNRGNESEILKEIFRVARRKVVLFEPAYEKKH